MITYCKENLQEIKQLIISLSKEQYTFKSRLLSGAAIGQHVRHILEFYTCLMNGVKTGTVNYDRRERNSELETDISCAIHRMDEICNSIGSIGNSEELILEGNFSSSKQKPVKIKTSFNRELAYCLEHSIHHQALIRIGLIEQGIENLITPGFGLAPATIRHREKCVQ